MSIPTVQSNVWWIERALRFDPWSDADDSLHKWYWIDWPYHKCSVVIRWFLTWGMGPMPAIDLRLRVGYLFNSLQSWKIAWAGSQNVAVTQLLLHSIAILTMSMCVSWWKEDYIYIEETVLGQQCVCWVIFPEKLRKKSAPKLQQCWHVVMHNWSLADPWPWLESIAQIDEFIDAMDAIR